MSYKIEVVSENGFSDYEIWTCQCCGRTEMISCGGDIACCPCEFIGDV